MATPTVQQISSIRGAGFSVPPFDYQAFTYIGSGASDDDDVATIVFKQGGSTGLVVATMTFTYVGSTNNVLTVTLTM